MAMSTTSATEVGGMDPVAPDAIRARYVEELRRHFSEGLYLRYSMRTFGLALMRLYAPRVPSLEVGRTSCLTGAVGETMDRD